MENSSSVGDFHFRPDVIVDFGIDKIILCPKCNKPIEQLFITYKVGNIRACIDCFIESKGGEYKPKNSISMVSKQSIEIEHLKGGKSKKNGKKTKS